MNLTTTATFTATTATATTIFGPVTIAELKPSDSGSTVTVRLHQRCTTTYPPGTRSQYALQEALSGTPDKQHVISSTRKATQRMSPADAEQLQAGQEIGGHISRTLRARPRYATQKAAYEGGYASSTWHPQYQDDVDERELATA